MQTTLGGAAEADRVDGTIAATVATARAAGAHLGNPPVSDRHTKRPHFCSYPIVFSSESQA